VEIETIQVIQKINGLPATINAGDFNKKLHALPGDAEKAEREPEPSTTEKKAPAKSKGEAK
jgi:hypothetical protein